MGSKAIRKPPKEFIEWLTKKGGKEFANWYVKDYGKAKTVRSAERKHMSRDAGTVGAYHDGHMRGAMDVHPKLGGGPTSSLSMFPEIGVVNVAHKELPRIPYEDMRKGGVPQNWFEDAYEQFLESEGLGVIGKYDTQAAMDMDAGMDPGQARAQADRRRQLRAQGVDVGPDTDPKFSPAPTPQGKDVPLPNLSDAMDAARERENKQIATRRSVRAKAKPEPEVFKQMRIQNMRKLAGKAAAAGVLGVGFLGTGASASETVTRTQIASETGDIADKIQAGISGISLAADVASYNPITAIPGTVISTGADATNIIIDQFRSGATHQRIRGRSGAQRALQGG
tara:strand:+ start:1430 stop:2446 length:1017 start_codon:yes stop_codon:yes gene_type:complete